MKTSYHLGLHSFDPKLTVGMFCTILESKAIYWAALCNS